MTGITIDQLYDMCLRQKALGNGSKCVLMSSDDEGNEYHQAWTGLEDGKALKPYVEAYQMRGCISDEVSDYVVLT